MSVGEPSPPGDKGVHGLLPWRELEIRSRRLIIWISVFVAIEGFGQLVLREPNMLGGLSLGAVYVLAMVLAYQLPFEMPFRLRTGEMRFNKERYFGNPLASGLAFGLIVLVLLIPPYGTGKLVAIPTLVVGVLAIARWISRKKPLYRGPLGFSFDIVEALIASALPMLVLGPFRPMLVAALWVVLKRMAVGLWQKPV